MKRGIFEDLINFEAWKHIEKWSEEECLNSMKRIDAISAKEININIVCEERGYRKGLRKFISEVKSLAEGR